MFLSLDADWSRLAFGVVAVLAFAVIGSFLVPG